MATLRSFLAWWIGGLIVFAIALWLHAPLAIDAVPGGIAAHQSATSGDEVNAIQTAWANAGLLPTARLAMSSDLVFITIYSFGALLGGLYFRKAGARVLSLGGALIVVAAILFAMCDYGETISELVQLLRMRGSDELAWLASTLRPIKMAAWLATFFGLLGLLVIRRFAHHRA